MRRLSALRVATAFIAVALFGFAALAYDSERPKAHKGAEPGEFDYYTLVLSWSPTHCLTEGHRRGDAQCDVDGDPDFILHGLWPQYDVGWPEDCYRGNRPWIPSAVIRDVADIMPGKGVIIHEYRSHGTCSGLSPAAYFSLARRALGQVTIPRAFKDPKSQRFVSPEKVENEFLAANKWMRPDMIAVTCRRGNLFDVRICFTKDLVPRACGRNSNQRRLCPLNRITVPVSRSDG